MWKGEAIEGVFDKPGKEEDMEDKVVVVVVGGCGGGFRRKLHREVGLREGYGRDNLLNINIVWPFVKLIDVFAFLTEQSPVGNARSFSNR